MTKYDHLKIEKKWQAVWKKKEEERLRKLSGKTVDTKIESAGSANTTVIEQQALILEENNTINNTKPIYNKAKLRINPQLDDRLIDITTAPFKQLTTKPFAWSIDTELEEDYADA